MSFADLFALQIAYQIQFITASARTRSCRSEYGGTHCMLQSPWCCTISSVEGRVHRRAHAEFALRDCVDRALCVDLGTL